MLVARLTTGVRDRPVKVDHLTAEITLGSVTHLSRLDIKILHLNIELVERMGRQPDENCLAVVWVSFLWRVRQYLVLPFLAVATRAQRYRLGEFVRHVVPFVVSEPWVMASWTWVLWVDIFALVGHTRII